MSNNKKFKKNKNKKRCLASGKLINSNDDVIKVKYAEEYLKKLGYKVISPKMMNTITILTTIFIVFGILILSSSFIGAENSYVVSEKVKLKLNSPLVYNVPIGYQKIAEIEIKSLNNIELTFSDFDFYDMNEDKKPLIRNIDLKIKTEKEIIVDNYDYICSNIWNDTINNYSKICEYKLIGTHKEIKENWEQFNKKDFKKNDIYMIGLFTDVKKGDFIEWVPTLNINNESIKIKKWAYWFENEEVEEKHTIAITGTQAGNGEGMAFNTKTDSEKYHLTGTKIHNQASASHLCLCSGGASTFKDCANVSDIYFIANASTNGGKSAEFDVNLSAGTLYQIIACNEGGAGTETYSTFPTPAYPIEGINIWWNFSAPNKLTTRMYFIESVNISNLTFMNEAPTITLLFPEDEEIFKIPKINFVFKAQDDLSSELNLSLFLNNNLIYQNVSVPNNQFINFEYTNLTNKTYEWYVKASDGELINISETRIFIIGEPINIFDIDLSTETAHFLIYILFGIALFFIFFKLIIYSALIVLLIGFIFLFNEMNIIISLLVLLTGIILIFFERSFEP